jgi:hypothetical protein
MTLAFEAINSELYKMAEVAAGHQRAHQEWLEKAQSTLITYRKNWPMIAQALALAEARKNPKVYRSARPFDFEEPLDSAIDPPLPPATATLIAADGSQIMPDRHAAYLYYLINIGGIVYHHGRGPAPQTFTTPQIVYPKDITQIERFTIGGGDVSIERDLKEIGALAHLAGQHCHEAELLLTVLDQRLLYWPIGGAGVADNAAVTEWGQRMSEIHHWGALLCGYIDRPETNSVLTLLQTLVAVPDEHFNWGSLGTRTATHGLVDRYLFSRILQPGQRSKVFLNISPPNVTFADQDLANEVCFFYLNPGQGIARVDIPRWVAENEQAVTAVHSLLVDQCRILGDYPYIIARADEMAVVTHQEHEELDLMINLAMQRYGLNGRLTAKQGSKGLTRAGKTRYEWV